ncbi:MAG: hypothetical protein FJZ92_14540 [Chloroflexi bacterium]|nr:hypothetical protein [Chloroflexota bacterium]
MLRDYLTPRWFLRLGGVTLVALGILGIAVWNVGGAGQNSVFYLTGGENVAHVVLGVVALGAAAVVRDARMLRALAGIFGVVALGFGIYGFTLEDHLPELNMFGFANLENPLDHLLHVVVGVWGLASAARDHRGADAPAAGSSGSMAPSRERARPSTRQRGGPRW